jgi:lysophospholipase L1-like esterase
VHHPEVSLVRYLLLLSLLSASVADARPIRVCLVGDSITAGFAPATRGWNVDLKTRHTGQDFGVKNTAHSGDTVALAADVLAKDVLGHGCTHVVFLIGTNDLAAGTSAATIYAGIDAMADLVEADTAPLGVAPRVVLAAILPRATGASFTANLETRRVSLNALLQARTGSTFVDTDTALRGTASGTAWASSTAYSLNAVRINDSGKAYVCTTAGTSAASGGPTGTGTGITDGTAVWSWVPALGTEYGGTTDGLHPNNTGMARIAATIDAAVTW